MKPLPKATNTKSIDTPDTEATLISLSVLRTTKEHIQQQVRDKWMRVFCDASKL